MKRLQWDNDKSKDLPPLEREIAALKEENRRLQGLLELREDRNELEKFQIQSRNRILIFCGSTIAIIVAVWVVSAVSMMGQIANQDREIKQDKDTIVKLKKGGALYLPNSQQ
jgi:hypothetical protein